MLKKLKPGFTLSELLVTLTLLGILSSFAIPKILQSTKGAEACNKITEAMAVLEQAWYSVKLQGYIPNATLYDNIIPLLNVLNSSANGVNQDAGGPLDNDHVCARQGNTDSHRGWVQLHNGVVISGCLVLATPACRFPKI